MLSVVNIFNMKIKLIKGVGLLRNKQQCIKHQYSKVILHGLLPSL